MRAALFFPALLAIAGCAASGSSATPEVADLNGKCDMVLTYDIDFQRFDETAQQIVHATGCSIQTDLSQTGAVKPQPVQGRYSPRQAVAKAIAGTGLKITDQQPDSITIE